MVHFPSATRCRGRSSSILRSPCSLRLFFFFSSSRRHTRSLCDWSSDVCSSDQIFFFQAEDGIRDLYVTGVQTSALPIFSIRPAGVAGEVVTPADHFDQIVPSA